MTYCLKCGQPMIPVTDGEDQTQRLGCPDKTCGYVFYDNPIPVVAAIVEKDGEIILARNAAWPQGMFALVTGFLEKGETPMDGVLREVHEELGLEPLSAEFIGYYSFFAMNQLILAYHVMAQGQVTLNHEIAEIKYLKPEKLKPWPFGTGLAVRDFLEKKVYGTG
ncbi:MAG: NUDIX domain-containing protein [Proteobacteria bacterium]|nr:NUDIX domain-containing protein [Pseudomonadota bacterium]